jgi:hypothetical protein
MHQVTVTPEPLRQPSPRCVAPRIRPMSLPWEGFSHKNSRMSVHPIPVVHGVAGIEDAEQRQGQQQTSRMRRRPLSRDGMAWAGWRAAGVCGPGAAISGARGSRWTLMELSPGDSSRAHGGRRTLRPPSMPGHFLRLGSFGAAGSWAAWGLGALCLLRLRAEGHGLDAERQDADAARVDLPGLARLILVVRPGFALHAADDQHAHAFLVQVFQCAASRCQISTGAQKPPRSSKSPPLVGRGCRNTRSAAASAAVRRCRWGTRGTRAGEPMLPSP